MWINIAIFFNIRYNTRVKLIIISFIYMTESTPETTPEVTSSPSAEPKKKPTAIIAIVVIILLLVGGFMVYKNYSSSDKASDEVVNEEPDDSGIVGGDLVAATLNGVNIMLSDVQGQANALIASSGVAEITPELQQQALQQSLQILVNQEILYQTAVGSGITADQSRVQEGIDEIINRFASTEEYQEALTTDGLTEDILRNSITKQLMVEKYVESIIDVDSITSTEEEVEALYEQYAAAQDNMPDIDEIYSQLEDELNQQKINAELSVLIEQLIEQSDFQIL